MDRDQALRNLAAAASAQFEARTRTDGTKFVTVRDNASDKEWLQKMCRNAHNGMFPDDTRYRFIVNALDAITECDDLDEIVTDPDGCIGDLSAWLGSHGERYAYVDEAVAELGHSDLGIIGDLMSGQQREKEEVLISVRQSLEDRLDETEEFIEDDFITEDDLITEDDVHFFLGGTLVLTVEADEDRDLAILAWMEREQFFPNVFKISDHGNVIRIDV